MKMRYDTQVLLLTKLQDDDPDGLDHTAQYTSQIVNANVKRTNLTLANGQMYDATVVRCFGEYTADAIGFIGEYNTDDESTIHQIQKVGRHTNRTDFYIIHGEVIFHG